jgi:hypothetical protein
MRFGKLIAVAAVALVGVALPAKAALDKDGDLITSFTGTLAPTALPRSAPAPVGVTVAGDVRSAGGDREALPQLRTIRVAINRRGRLYYRGLPVCKVEEIQPATEQAARRQCGGALVGSGHVTVLVHVPNQPTFQIKARVLAFNGPRHHGRKQILAQAYARQPPGAFIITFTISRRKGLFGTVLSTSLPPSAREWAYLTHFDMTLRRTYWYRGVRRSFVSAACPAPAGFRSAVFPFARAAYGFADGRRLSISISDRCTVRRSGHGG